MPTPEAFKSPFYCSQFYHLVFKSIDGLLLFQDDSNRAYFLQRFSFFLSPVFDCYTYCLLSNHVHFIVCVKENILLLEQITTIPNKLRTIAMKRLLADSDNELIIDEVIERQVNRFMVSYANAYNNTLKRHGNLFQSPFRRSIIQDDEHLQQAIIYVHGNPQKHGLVLNYDSYSHSSFQDILIGNAQHVVVEKVLAFFGGLTQFIHLHQQQIAYYYTNHWPITTIDGPP